MSITQRSQPQPGDVLDGTYRIDRVLGYGGVGVVCAAWHLHVQRPCAVKFLHPQFVGNPELRARFRREAQSAFQLGHPHIVSITDFRDDPMGWPYIVMELVSGETLRDRLSRGPLAPPVAVRMMIELCDALHTAHRRAVIHRDLKPENLFLVHNEGRQDDSDLFLKVLDFGLSKILDESDITETGRLLGSPSYMSPEQARGDSHLVDERSDIFAVGALLYECLTGYKLFEAPSFEQKRHLIMSAQLPPLRLTQRGMPEELERIIKKCCALLPEDRYQSALDLANELSDLYAGEGGVERPDGTGRLRRNSLLQPVVVVLPGIVEGMEETLPASGPLMPASPAPAPAPAQDKRPATPPASATPPPTPPMPPPQMPSSPPSATSKSQVSDYTTPQSASLQQGEVVPDLRGGGSSGGVGRVAGMGVAVLLLMGGGILGYRYLQRPLQPDLGQGGEAAIPKGSPTVVQGKGPAAPSGESGRAATRPQPTPAARKPDRQPDRQQDRQPDKQQRGEVTELTMATIDPVMMGGRSRIARCFPAEEALPRRLSVDLVIGPSGKVSEATADLPGMDQRVGGCVVDQLLRLRFPSSPGEPVSVHYEFVNLQR